MELESLPYLRARVLLHIVVPLTFLELVYLYSLRLESLLHITNNKKYKK